MLSPLSCLFFIGCRLMRTSCLLPLLLLLGSPLNAQADRGNTYSIPVTVTSKLPFPKVPLDPKINFPSIIQQAKLPGVLDPNSIKVINLSTNQVEPHALSPHFRNNNHGHVRWIARDLSENKYEIRFQIIKSRSILKPSSYIPMIGVGDLVRYNANEPRPVSLFYVSRMVDLTGDGRNDIIGCECYTTEPNWPAERVPKGWGNIMCLPVLESQNDLLVGDAIKLRYREPGSTSLHFFDAGYLHGDIKDLNGDGLPDLTYSTHPKSAYASIIKGVSDYIHVFLNTGELDESGMPIFQISPERIPHPKGQWAPVRAVDLNNDGATDLVLGTMFSSTNTTATYLKNGNADNWPIRMEKPIKIETGNNASFIDVDQDGKLDSICLIPDKRGKQTSFNNRVAWRRNLGSDPPEFGPPEILEDIDIPFPLLTTTVRGTKQPGILVCGSFGANLSFYKQEEFSGTANPHFSQQVVKSISAPVRAGDQATPFPCDWDHDGDWDLLVGGGYGIVKIILNMGSNEKPSFDEPKPVLADGTPVEISMSNIFPNLKGYFHDLGYVHPTFIDWDADGLPDLMLPNLSNRIFWHKNKGTLEKPLFGSRQQIICDGYPESEKILQATAKLLGSETKQWTKRIPDPNSPFWWRSRAGFGDFNGDGIMDLVTADAQSPLSPNRFALHSRIFVQYRDSKGNLHLRKDRTITYPDGTKMKNGSGSAAQMIVVDWDNDGLLDLLINEGKTNYTCPTLIFNIGTKTNPEFDFPRKLSCFGEEMSSIAKHGPYYGVGDLDKDGKCDLLACPEAGTYLFFRGTAMEMNASPTFEIGNVKKHQHNDPSG
jgi:FG-GAP-like repeat